MPLRMVEHKLSIVKVPVGEVIPSVTVLLTPPPLTYIAGIVYRNKKTEALMVALGPLPAVLRLVGVYSNALPTPLVLGEVTLVLEPVRVHLNPKTRSHPILAVTDERVAVTLLELPNSVVFTVLKVALVHIAVRRGELPAPFHLSVLEFSSVGLSDGMCEDSPSAPLSSLPVSQVLLCPIRTPPYSVPIPIIVLYLAGVNVTIRPLDYTVSLEDLILHRPRCKHP
mmetsp:Transcript_22436/g.46644  ORF Transcript_22436/g.46644 Transcript_22436/m.46644 type:complete len:225 (-) Transcript_22436:211-885(-)